MATPEPDLSRLSPSQRFRWLNARDACADARRVDPERIPPDVAMMIDRTRAALADMLRLTLEDREEG